MESDVAWYALTVSIIALLISAVTATINVVKWWGEGVKLRVHIHPELVVIGGYPEDRDRYIGITAINRGTAKTTIIGVILAHDPGWFRAVVLRGKSQLYAPVQPGLPNQPTKFPDVIEPGTRWQTFLPHAPRVEPLMREGRLFVGLNWSHQDKPTWHRVERPKAESKKP